MGRAAVSAAIPSLGPERRIVRPLGPETPAEARARRAQLRRDRAAQGLPETMEDAATLDVIAALLGTLR